jgi:hypothetical protein
LGVSVKPVMLKQKPKGRTPLLKSNAATVQAAVCEVFYAKAFPHTEKL